MSDKKDKKATGNNKGKGANTPAENTETSTKTESTEVSETTEAAAAEETAPATETTVDPSESTTETTTSEWLNQLKETSETATEENSGPKVGDVVDTENGKETHGAGYDPKAGKYTPAPAPEPEPEKKAEPEAAAESADGYHILTESDLIQFPMWAAAGLKAGDKVAPLPKAKSAEDENAEMISHTITPEDMQNYPELADEGLKVGDTVRIPKDAASLVKKSDAETSATETKTETAPAATTAAPAQPETEVIYQIAVTGDSLRKMFEERQKTTLPAFSEKEVRQVVGDLEPLMLKYQLEKSEDQKGFAVVLEDADSKLRIPTEGYYPLGIDYSQPAVK